MLVAANQVVMLAVDVQLANVSAGWKDEGIARFNCCAFVATINLQLLLYVI